VPLESCEDKQKSDLPALFVEACRGNKILILDQAIRAELRQLLKKLGITVTEAASLAEALQKLAEEKYAVEHVTDVLNHSPCVLFLLNCESAGLSLEQCAAEVTPRLKGLPCTLALLEREETRGSRPDGASPVSPVSPDGYVLLHHPLTTTGLMNVLRRAVRVGTHSLGNRQQQVGIFPG
jgi:CheY-like chemotaxis protein